MKPEKPNAEAMFEPFWRWRNTRKMLAKYEFGSHSAKASCGAKYESRRLAGFSNLPELATLVHALLQQTFEPLHLVLLGGLGHQLLGVTGKDIEHVRFHALIEHDAVVR